MGVDDVDSVESLHLGEVEAEGFEGTLEFGFGAVGDLRPGFAAAYMEVSLIGVLRTPAVDFDFDFAGQLAAEVVDMNAGAPINKRRNSRVNRPARNGPTST